MAGEGRSGEFAFLVMIVLALIMIQVRGDGSAFCDWGVEVMFLRFLGVLPGILADGVEREDCACTDVEWSLFERSVAKELLASSG